MMRLISCLASNNQQISFDVNLKNRFYSIHKTFKQENVRNQIEMFDTIEDKLEDFLLFIICF
jgi:hypothetical protein